MLVKAHDDAGNHTFISTVPYKHFRSAWYAFLALLEIDYTGGFQCPRCGPHPHTLVMDATGLSFRRELGFWNSHDTMIDVSKDRVPKGRLAILWCLCCITFGLYVHSFSKRVLINDKKTRQLLGTYAKRGLSAVGMEEMMELIDCNAPFLRALIEHVHEEIQTKIHHCSRKWMRFIQSISSTSAVCSLIPPVDEVLELVDEICKRDVTSNPEVNMYNKMYTLMCIR